MTGGSLQERLDIDGPFLLDDAVASVVAVAGVF